MAGVNSSVRFLSYPRTKEPPAFVATVIQVFKHHEPALSTLTLDKGLTSDQALAMLRDELMALGFEVEGGKRATEKIKRPVFFGENGAPERQYEIDAYHPGWRAGLEIEAGRAWMGNAVYRDIVQAMVMVNLDYLILAVPNQYKFKVQGKASQRKGVVSRDFDNTASVADALFSHARVAIPFGLVLIGY